MQQFDDETRKAALGFVEGLYAGGSTNIDGALRTALGQLQDSSRPSYVIFLTDGLPTAGETNEMKIVANAKEANKVHARIFAFGVGYDVNSRLLDKLVRENFGQSEYVRPERGHRGPRQPALQPHRVARDDRRARSSSPSTSTKTEEGQPVNRVYPKGSFDLFAGEQLVVVGRYKKPGTAKVIVSGTVGGKQQKFDFPAKLVDKSSDETLRLHREALGGPPRGRDPRRAGPEGQERRAGQGAGRAGHAARHPHAVHVVHGRRAVQPPRPGGQRRPGRAAAGGPRPSHPARAASCSGRSRATCSGPMRPRAAQPRGRSDRSATPAGTWAWRRLSAARMRDSHGRARAGVGGAAGARRSPPEAPALASAE